VKTASATTKKEMLRSSRGSRADPSRRHRRRVPPSRTSGCGSGRVSNAPRPTRPNGLSKDRVTSRPPSPPWPSRHGSSHDPVLTSLVGMRATRGRRMHTRQACRTRHGHVICQNHWSLRLFFAFWANDAFRPIDFDRALHATKRHENADACDGAHRFLSTVLHGAPMRSPLRATQRCGARLARGMRVACTIAPTRARTAAVLVMSLLGACGSRTGLLDAPFSHADRSGNSGTTATGQESSLSRLVATSSTGFTSSTSVSTSVGSVNVQPNCQPGGPGLTDCPGSRGPESCCTSLEVTGGTFVVTYTNDGAGAAAHSAPDTLSGRYGWGSPSVEPRFLCALRRHSRPGSVRRLCVPRCRFEPSDPRL
jgi:hypothetical protein